MSFRICEIGIQIAQDNFNAIKQVEMIKYNQKIKIMSLYYDHVWEIGKTYKVPKLIIQDGIINEGFHADIYTMNPEKPLKEIMEDIIYNGRTFVYANVTVPRGAQYAINPYAGEIVASAMKINFLYIKNERLLRNLKSKDLYKLIKIYKKLDETIEEICRRYI